MDRDSVLKAVGQSWKALEDVGEVWRSDKEVVLAAVQANGKALRFAAEELKGDREIVLAAVRQNAFALEHATEALQSDREVVLAAVQNDGYVLKFATEATRADREVVLTAVQQTVYPREQAYALTFAADELLEDPSFATEAKRRQYLLKVTMLSGRSTVVAACHRESVGYVLFGIRRKLGLDDAGSTLELWHCSGERVPAGARMEDWPGIQPSGEISEYQLLLR